MTIPFSGADEHGERVDPGSDTWRAVLDWAAQQRTVAVKTLLKQGVDLPQTEYLRGQIAVLDRLENLGRIR